MTAQDRPIQRFELGPFRLDASTRTLALDGETLAIAPKAVDTLVALVEHGGAVVSKEALLERVWPGSDVEEANISQNVYVLRKALRAHSGGGEWIVTVPKRGYRYTGPLRPFEEPPVHVRSARRTPRAAWLAAACFLALALALVPAARGRVRPDGSALSAAGVQAYTLGRYYWNQRTIDGIQKSVRYFQEVVRDDPHGALGYAALSEAYAMMPMYNVRSLSKAVAMERAWRLARKAIAVDRQSSEAHAALGELESVESKRPGGGQTELERAVALDPQSPNAHLWLGVALYERGDLARARAEFETSERLQPAAPATQSWLADVLYLDRDYDAAAEHLHRALDIDPNRSDALAQLGTVEVQRGAFDRALDAYGRFARTCSCGGYSGILKAYAYARMHRDAKARATLLGAEHSLARGKDASVDVALVYVALNDRSAALSWLQRMHHTEPEKVDLLAADPRLDPVRRDRRFDRWTESHST